MQREDALTRLRVAVQTGRLPVDLGEWLLATLEDSTRRKLARNRALLDAAAQVGGSTYARARWLAAELREIRADPRYWQMVDRGGELRACLVRCLVHNGQEPLSERSIRRIIADGIGQTDG